MPYQYKREPLTPDEANRLASACETHAERLIVWTLLDTGLRVSELARLTREHIDWQHHRLMIYGKGGPYGTKSKRRILPLTDRLRPLIDGHFAIHDSIGMTPRTIQRLLKRIANKARINRPVCPHVLRHYADTQTMPRQGVVRDYKSSLYNELFHFLTYAHAA
jgi:integrase/recombinase XerD